MLKPDLEAKFQVVEDQRRECVENSIAYDINLLRVTYALFTIHSRIEFPQSPYILLNDVTNPKVSNAQRGPVNEEIQHLNSSYETKLEKHIYLPQRHQHNAN